MMNPLQVLYSLSLFVPIALTYSIQSCGKSEPSIQYLINIAQGTVINPLYDVHLGTSSTHGYTAMYKSNVFKNFLRSLLFQISQLSNTHAAGRDQEPTFVCVKPDMAQEYDMDIDPLQHCTDTGVASFWAKDTALIFLCPSFMDLRVQPAFTPGGPRDIYCPVVHNNVFLGKSDPLVKYQLYELLYQLVHLYLQGDGLSDESNPKEVTDWNDCVGLGWAPFEGSPSVRNPYNLVYYIAFTNQQCTQMPDPFQSPFSGGDGRTGLLSAGNMTGVSLTNLTDLRLQS